MSPACHLAVSGALGAGTYFLTDDWAHAAAVGLSGVVIDIDHVYDFCLEWGFKKGLRNLAENSIHGPRHRSKHIYLLLHGWDVLLVFMLLAVYVFENPYMFSAGAGAVIHLFLDQIANEARPLSYILLYRIRKGFRRDLLVYSPAERVI